MPNSRNRRRVRLVWHLLATAFLRCAHQIFSSVLSTASGDGRLPSHQNRIEAAIAVCTWHSVSSGFSPPKFLPRPCQEQVAHRAQDQVAFQTLVSPTLILIQSH